jgi:3-dehydroquinate synthase
VTAPEPIAVELGPRSYEVHVGLGNLDATGELARAVAGSAAVALLTNPTVDALYGERVRASLEAAGVRATTIAIPDGERHKNLETLGRIWDRLAEARIERGGALLALGGGVVGDVTGFAAATWLRGVAFAQVPTTLVAQIDAAIGGKTAIDLPGGKNLVGAFHQPRFVLADVRTLLSLPEREYRAGLAEVVKTGAILSSGLFELLERESDRVLARDEELLLRIVHECAGLKARVVSVDENEGDLRAILNFGHTLGHAVEMLQGYEGLLHGEAVSIGMAFATGVSTTRCGLAPEPGGRLLALLGRFGLPTRIPGGLSPRALARAMEADKKRTAGRVKFVCLEELGRTRFENLATDDLAPMLASHMGVNDG